MMTKTLAIGLRLAAALALSVVPNIALAHPGHGSTEADTWLHHVTEPAHIVWLLVALAAGFVIRMLAKTRLE